MMMVSVYLTHRRALTHGNGCPPPSQFHTRTKAATQHFRCEPPHKLRPPASVSLCLPPRFHVADRSQYLCRAVSLANAVATTACHHLAPALIPRCCCCDRSDRQGPAVQRRRAQDGAGRLGKDEPRAPAPAPAPARVCVPLPSSGPAVPAAQRGAVVCRTRTSWRRSATRTCGSRPRRRRSSPSGGRCAAPGLPFLAVPLLCYRLSLWFRCSATAFPCGGSLVACGWRRAG